MVLYGTMGILAGLLLVLVDNGANISLKRQQLADGLVDYVENSPHFYKAGGNAMESADGERRLSGKASEQKARLHGLGRNRRKTAESDVEIENRENDAECSEVAAADVGYGIVQLENTVEKRVGAGMKKQKGKKLPLLSRKKGRKEPAAVSVQKNAGILGTSGVRTQENLRMQRPDEQENMRSQETDLAKSIDSLKQSLDQIAASREQTRRELQVVRTPENEKLEKVRKELSPEDLKFLGELLQEYLK